MNPWEGFLPDWLPVWGGTYYSSPVYNIADASIFLGVVTILLFQNHFIRQDHEQRLRHMQVPPPEAPTDRPAV